MELKCLFGHKWNGCKCEKCGTTRDEGHKWILLDGWRMENKDIAKCSVCGKKRGVEWNGCKCTKYDTGYSIKEGTCTICGVELFTQNEFKKLSKHFTGKSTTEVVNLSQADIQSLCRIYGTLVQNLNSGGQREQIRELSPVYSKLVLLSDNAPREAKAMAKLSVRNLTINF